HPRTCIGITQEDILLIIVDGRHLEAKGMNLHELQDFLSGLDCRDAINLDGGGSTTLWLNTETYKGVANCPSDNKNFDNKGERKVANVILLNEIRKAH
ncbi:MAG: phosphodiester glycosidase family protein, partial [Bacteroidetes bacterium]|nr:phosphodiester glycosidase family protein [Bacteroidota bacterium]